MLSPELQIQRSREYFESRDTADSEELARDILSAIPHAVAEGDKRLITLTNVNDTVIEKALAIVKKKAKGVLRSSGLSLEALRLTKDEEISFRWKLTTQSIPTLVIESHISIKQVYFY